MNWRNKILWFLFFFEMRNKMALDETEISKIASKVASNILSLIRSQNQPIEKSRQDSLNYLKQSLEEAFGSIEGVEITHNDNIDNPNNNISGLEKEVNNLRKSIADLAKTHDNNYSKMNNTMYELRAKEIAELRHQLDALSMKVQATVPMEKSEPVVITVFKGKENVNGVDLTYSNVHLPEKKCDGDSGYDGYVCFADGFEQEITIMPGKIARIPLGIQCEIPKGYEIQVRPRSGNDGKQLHACWGTVDSKYRGIIKVNFENTSKDPYTVKTGDRICQLVVGKVEDSKMVFAEEGRVIEETERGSNGFGSTGK